MPSLGDSAVIILLGLLLFGPKGLAQIARQLGKLMGEFRRASNEFRMQMEEELRVSEQTERQKEIAAIEAAAPTPPPILGTPASDCPEDHPHLRSVPSDILESSAPETPVVAPETETVPLPIATSGELKIMPPATGLPQPRSSSLAPLLNSVPHVDPTEVAPEVVAEVVPDHSIQRPKRYTNGASNPIDLTHTDAPAAEESLHG